MSFHAAYAESKPTTRVRVPEMPESIARLLSLVLVLFLSSGLAFFRQGSTLRNFGRAFSNPFHPRYLYIAFLIFMFGSMLFPNKAIRQKILPNRVFWACFLFAFYIVVQILFAPSTDLYWFVYRLEFMFMLPAFIITLGSVSQPAFVFRALRWVTVAESLLYVGLFLRPHSIPEMMEFGRPAGLWENPNVAAHMTAGVLPLITFRLRPLPRAFVYAVTLAGVLATLSREGVLLWVEMFLLSTFFPLDRTDKVSSSEKIFYGFGILLAPLLSLSILSRNVMNSLAGMTPTSIARLSVTQDFSIRERGYVLQHGWESFEQSPIFGNGLGYTANWDYAVSTHNMFVLVLAEHGIVGMLLLLTWIASFRSYVGATRLWMITFFVTIGMFSHNLFEGEYAILFALYWLAAFVPEKAEVRATLTGTGGQPLAA